MLAGLLVVLSVLMVVLFVVTQHGGSGESPLKANEAKDATKSSSTDAAKRERDTGAATDKADGDSNKHEASKKEGLHKEGANKEGAKNEGKTKRAALSRSGREAVADAPPATAQSGDGNAKVRPATNRRGAVPQGDARRAGQGHFPRGRNDTDA